MITVQEAQRLIMETVSLWPATVVPTVEATDRILREPLVADRDFPPFDRVAMDGIAIAQAAFAAGNRRFEVTGRQMAGAAPITLAEGAVCCEIMTGAMLPQGADSVIRYEDLEMEEVDGKTWATITLSEVRLGQNVHQQASDRSAGDELLAPGRRLSPADIAVAASVGKPQLKASSLPRVAVVSNGDELVPVEAQPHPHQIRRSNGITLQAALRELGVEANIFHLPDDRKAIERGLAQILGTHDVIILSGGVSKGKADFIPDTLASLKVEEIFHRVTQRPGKPFWFGKGHQDQIVFALPGNPVSTFVGYYRYIRPWLLACLGSSYQPLAACLAAPFTFNPDLTYFLQVQVSTNEDGVLIAEPVPGGGSGDFANLLACDGFLELPRGRNDFAAGDTFPLYLYRPLR
ncbi:MAG: molybdopterin molybdenumtransferase MoeA [Bacteroidetes bacterium]|nr:MAG: molybdopterin molybdenumtransferase MoeA [Bacteroidota bacterium]